MLRALSLLFLVSSSIFAADVPKYEVSAFGGVATRVPNSSGADGNFGGNFSIGAGTMLFAEFARNAGGFGYLDVHGGLKQNLTTRGRFEPYVLAGVGMARMRALIVGNTSSPSVNAGFGTRVYVGRNWGIQPEFRWLRFFGSPDINLMRTTAGIFLQWGYE